MKIRENSVENYDLIKKSLDVSSLRSETISNNLTNINTKGYKRVYVTFEEALKDSQTNINMKETNTKHISLGQGYGDVEVKKDTTTAMREDGNNVDLDNEIVNQAANTLMYDALITEINNKISMRRSVIKGGK